MRSDVAQFALEIFRFLLKMELCGLSRVIDLDGKTIESAGQLA
jgi:hypothetical protein